jgi:beta-N-acetylhexosaminidase
LLGLVTRPATAQQPLTLDDSLMVEHLIDSLPLRAKVAQLVMPWMLGTYAAIDDSLYLVQQRWVDSLEIGGIISSVGTPTDVAIKLNRLQRLAKIPLLVSSDLEGGASFRLTGGTVYPTNMGIAATGRDSDAYEVGRVTALEGRAAGIHLAFAPVADVNNNPNNPIINTRSYGEDPHRVGRLVAATVKGIQDHGMLATVKHFPGHGDTETDSHIGLPVIPATYQRLDTLELVPFRDAIAANVAVVMSAHVALPKLIGEPGRPATLAPSMLTGLLRDSLHFTGLVVTDALDMAGVVNTYGAGEAAVQAFMAGTDLLLMPADPAGAIATMTSAVETGRVSYERLIRSVRRILQLKARLGLFRQRTVPLDSVSMIVGSARFLPAAREIATRSVVLVSDSAGTLDSLRAAPRRIAYISYGEENAGSVGAVVARQLRAAGHQVHAFRLWPASGKAAFDSAEALTRKHPYTIFAISVRVTTAKGTIGLPEPVADLVENVSRRRRALVVSLGSPYIGLGLKHLKSYLVGWSSNSVSEYAVGQAIAGRTTITGTLPVSLPPSYRIGHGLQRLTTMQ